MKVITFTLLAATLALTACKPPAGGTSAAPGNEAPIATVNGTPVPRELFNFFVRNVSQGKEPSDLTPEQRQEALDNLVRAELVAQQADKDGVTKLDSTHDLLEMARLQALQQAVSQKFLKDNKPTDDELHKEYDAQIANLPHSEYHAAHILVASQAQATQLIDQLDHAKGANFADLARASSSDPSKDKGGDLGWFTPDRMVKPFADALVALKPGEYTRTPVQTQFGWHVIKLVETRPLNVPAFESVKDRLTQIVVSKKFKAYVDGLVTKAQIDKKI